MRHAEEVKKVGNVALSLTGDFHTLEVEITVGGRIDKLLRLSESEASWLYNALGDALADRPEDGRADRFNASVRASRS